MYLLYLDESIKKGCYLVGGVMIVGSKHRKLVDDFEIFWKSEGFNENIMLHSEHLWNSRNDFKKIDMSQRAKISKNISLFLKETTITRFFVGYRHVKKGSIEDYLKILEEIIEKAVQFIASKGSKKSKQLLIIFDRKSCGEKINKDINNEIARKYKEIKKTYKKSCHIIDCGYWGASKNSRLLQFADYISYFINRYLSLKRNDTLFEKKHLEIYVNCIDEIYRNLSNKIEIIKSNIHKKNMPTKCGKNSKCKRSKTTKIVKVKSHKRRKKC